MNWWGTVTFAKTKEDFTPTSRKDFPSVYSIDRVEINHYGMGVLRSIDEDIRTTSANLWQRELHSSRCSRSGGSDIFKTMTKLAPSTTQEAIIKACFDSYYCYCSYDVLRTIIQVLTSIYYKGVL